MTEAEERTAEYYCIPPRHWLRLPYDLITREDREWEPLPGPVLAKTQRLAHVNTRSREPLEFFRIQLNDPTILRAARRERLEPNMYPFLVYILTHEMVHLVRLGTILDSPASAEMEEERVDRISRQILFRTDSEHFRPVFERFPGVHPWGMHWRQRSDSPESAVAGG